MAINGTDFINHPWNTTFGTYTDLLGTPFWLIPVSFIAIALYIKTRNPVVATSFMVGSGLLLSSGNMFMGAPEMVFVYTVFTVISFVGLLSSIYFIRK